MILGTITRLVPANTTCQGVESPSLTGSMDTDTIKVYFTGPQKKQGPEEVVPTGDYGNGRPRGQSGFGHRDHNPAVDPKLTAAIDGAESRISSGTSSMYWRK